MFLAVRRDPEGHHEAVLPDVHAVEQQRHEVEAVQRRRLPRPQLRRRLRHEPAADTALARAAAHHPGRQRLQTPRILAGRDAHQHLFDDAAIQRVGLGQCLHRGQGHLPAPRPHPRPLDPNLTAAEHHLAGYRTRARRVAHRGMRISWPTEGRAIFFEHRVEHPKARADHQLQEFGFRVHQDVHQRQGSDGRRFNSG